MLGRSRRIPSRKRPVPARDANGRLVGVLHRQVGAAGSRTGGKSGGWSRNDRHHLEIGTTATVVGSGEHYHVGAIARIGMGRISLGTGHAIAEIPQIAGGIGRRSIGKVDGRSIDRRGEQGRRRLLDDDQVVDRVGIVTGGVHHGQRDVVHPGLGIGYDRIGLVGSRRNTARERPDVGDRVVFGQVGELHRNGDTAAGRGGGKVRHRRQHDLAIAKQAEVIDPHLVAVAVVVFDLDLDVLHAVEGREIDVEAVVAEGAGVTPVGEFVGVEGSGRFRMRGEVPGAVFRSGKHPEGKGLAVVGRHIDNERIAARSAIAGIGVIEFEAHVATTVEVEGRADQSIALAGGVVGEVIEQHGPRTFPAAADHGIGPGGLIVGIDHGKAAISRFEVLIEKEVGTGRPHRNEALQRIGRRAVAISGREGYAIHARRVVGDGRILLSGRRGRTARERPVPTRRIVERLVVEGHAATGAKHVEVGGEQRDRRYGRHALREAAAGGRIALVVVVDLVERLVRPGIRIVHGGSHDGIGATGVVCSR